MHLLLDLLSIQTMDMLKDVQNDVCLKNIFAALFLVMEVKKEYKCPLVCSSPNKP